MKEKIETFASDLASRIPEMAKDSPLNNAEFIRNSINEFFGFGKCICVWCQTEFPLRDEKDLVEHTKQCSQNPFMKTCMNMLNVLELTTRDLDAFTQFVLDPMKTKADIQDEMAVMANRWTNDPKYSLVPEEYVQKLAEAAKETSNVPETKTQASGPAN